MFLRHMTFSIIPTAHEHKSFTHLLLWFQPGVGVLYCVSQSEEPGLPQTNSATHQVEQVFAFPLHLRKSAPEGQ